MPPITLSPPEHPFKRWKEAQSLTWEEAAHRVHVELLQLLSERGGTPRSEKTKVNHVYLQQVCSGRGRLPSGNLALAMAAATRGHVSASEILAYRRRPKGSGGGAEHATAE